MFYGSSVSSMSPSSKNKLKRHSRIFTQVLYRTLSYRDRRSVSALPDLGSDDPAELSTQLSAPGVLKVFGGNICAGTNYKSVLATPCSSARELVKEALERYALSKLHSSHFVLCDVIGRFEGPEKQWQTECLRVLGDNEKPLLIQDLWKPKEGFSRRFELRKRSEMEELAAKEVDTITAGINAQARKLQRNRAKGATTVTSGCKSISAAPSFRRTVSETSLNHAEAQDEKVKRHYSTLPEALWIEDSVNEMHGPSGERSGVARCSLYQCPHLLLLQGYNQQYDNLVYLLNCEQYTVGQKTPSSKPNIILSAPDILPLHCTIRKIKSPSRSGHRSDEKLALEPGPGAYILVNFSEVGKATLLRHGDLLSLGLYYLLLFRDPVSTQPLPASALGRLKSLSRGADPRALSTCKVCGNVLKSRSSRRHGLSSSSSPCSRSNKAPRKKLHLEFGRAVEDVLLERILALIEPGGDDHKLTPVFLLCLCIQHSATNFEPGEFGQLLLKMAKEMQRIVWDRTKELAEKQSQQQDPASLSRLTIADLIPDLQHILFWMSNAIELLYFTQQKSPIYIQSMEEEMDIKGSKESLFSSTITASEEAMTILEEVIMYTFQQCVYYISKSLYVSLPALIEGHSSPNENWHVPSHLPEEVCRVVLIYQATLDLLHQYEVHPEIASQMFAYLFFFSNTLLFNQLTEKGPTLGCFRWSKGVKIRARLRLLLEWIQNAGYGHLGQQFFGKLLSVANLLATPSSQLLQMTWHNLRVEFSALSCAQLHCVLRNYQLASSLGGLTAWQPSEEDHAAAFRTEDLLESFDNHPPIILPSEGFKVDLDKDSLDDNIYRHLLYIRHFLWSLQSKASVPKTLPETDHQQNETSGYHPLTERNSEYQNSCTTDGNSLNRSHLNRQRSQIELEAVGRASLGCCANGQERGLPSSEERLKEKLRQLQLQSSLGNHLPKASMQPLDSSCLLTPPNTPSNSDQGTTDPLQIDDCSKAVPEPRRDEIKTKATEGSLLVPFDFPTPASSSRSSDTDEFCYVFVVELEKGPIGLGMGLIDGLHTPLNTPGIYIRTLLPDSPVASDGRLSIGDRILAVNGTSLIGADYKSAVDLIRTGGKKLRFLVAKSDMEIAEKISSGSSC
uniref:Ras-associating and dilute domain-containing protein n=1 Tax=Geotrypetes seraphini TaxID=260995 RepID=A0A6P8N4G6_GEOSA|nr:ras-associating and dilute domain-containing protein isoform X1 [Geotrypetes seraphini]XP_033770313.1 ras-associating and dilute domain-containing protein isoform X1 [Geotrypetes seraphini]